MTQYSLNDQVLVNASNADIVFVLRLDLGKFFRFEGHVASLITYFEEANSDWLTLQKIKSYLLKNLKQKNTVKFDKDLLFCLNTLSEHGFINKRQA